MYRDPRKNIPNIPATESAWTTLAPETLRERKIRSGMSGLRGRGLTHDEGDEQQRARAPPSPSARPEPQP